MSLIVNSSLIKLRDGRLHLYQQNDSKNWLWRTFQKGKYFVRSTRTDNLAIARSTAENEYDKLRFQSNASDGTLVHSWEECERGLLTSLSDDVTTRPSRIKNYKLKLGILIKYFKDFPIHTIKTKSIEEYLSWRRDVYKPSRNNYHSKTVANKTLRSDLLILRQVLKYAKREDFIKTIPDFPKVTVKPRAGGWFSTVEMNHLISCSKKWIKEAANEEERKLRSYAHYYMSWLVSTGMRVDEALCVRFEDVEIKKKNPEVKVIPRDHLFVNIRGGKLSHTKGPTEMIGLYTAVHAFERLKQLNPNAQPSDLLFPLNPRETIGKLLEKAGLSKDDRGQRRTAKSFRHTYIMKRLQQDVNPFKLARNCRTSTKMMEDHYASYLTARMTRNELLKNLGTAKE